VPASDERPQISRPLLGGFQWFVGRYLQKHFHAVAVHQQPLLAADIQPQDSLVVYANHASWWDPLSAIFLAQAIFPAFRMYAPIDAQALTKYKVFAKMGFFPVDQNTMRGAANFLRISQSILSEPGASIWITPEGRFADVRDTEASLMPGLAHLAYRLAANVTGDGLATGQRPGRLWFVNGAVEYTFWEERLPELLVWFGEPVCINDHLDVSKLQWAELLAERLRAAQRKLAAAAIARDSSPFEVFLGGKSGTFFLYDWGRKLSAKLAGRQLDIDHSCKLPRN
jgi:1-acyl-sn-glycerol-3-phosphate acyltransferase